MTLGMVSDDIDIEARLRRRGAWCVEDTVPIAEARRREAATIAIAAGVPTFERVRDAAIGRSSGPLSDVAACGLIASLQAAQVLDADAHGVFPASAAAERYLRGGWLEEHIGLASVAAGADEVRIGQKIGWVAGGFEGENEIDTIARFGERLVFVSAKALRSRLADGDQRHRERLMQALQEADNLIDHFGDTDSAVALVVSTDLWDERERRPRYEQLHGKAVALGVTLVTLETLERGRLVDRLRTLGRRGER